MNVSFNQASKSTTHRGETFASREAPHRVQIERLKKILTERNLQFIEATLENTNADYELKKMLRANRSHTAYVMRAQPDLIVFDENSAINADVKTGKTFPLMQFLRNAILSHIDVFTLYFCFNNETQHEWCFPVMEKAIKSIKGIVIPEYVSVNHEYVSRKNAHDSIESYIDIVKRLGISAPVKVDEKKSGDPFLYLDDGFVRDCRPWSEYIDYLFRK